MIKLMLKLSEFELLHKRADKRKERITIRTDILRKLLVDHSSILAGLSDNGIKYKEPDDPVYSDPAEQSVKKKTRLRIRKKT